MNSLELILADLPERMSRAVGHYWNTRARQATVQTAKGDSDRGSRSAVTGGAQMDGFLELIANYLQEIGIPSSCIHFHSRLELPGFFRPTKKWDLLVVKDGQLVLALEAKSQVGSFGNNFNNRTEEAMGSALDLWTAFRQGVLNPSAGLWLGYLFLLQDCPASNRAVRAEEPHFRVLPEFRSASYASRYESFCRKLVRERHYQSAAFLMSEDSSGSKGHYREPATDLTANLFLRSLLGHASAYV